jgi:hypothetical protein
VQCSRSLLRLSMRWNNFHSSSSPSMLHLCSVFVSRFVFSRGSLWPNDETLRRRSAAGAFFQLDGHDCALEQRGVDTNLPLRAHLQPPAASLFKAFFHSSSIIISIVGKTLMDPMMERTNCNGIWLSVRSPSGETSNLCLMCQDPRRFIGSSLRKMTSSTMDEQQRR